MDFCGKSSGFADFWKHSGSWISCEFWREFLIVPVLMFLNQIWIIDLSSALVGMLRSSVISFFKWSAFKFRCETVIGMVLCNSHQACCILYYLCEIHSGIHIYQFAFELLHFCFWMWLLFRIRTRILADRLIWQKKDTDRWICIPLFTPLLQLHHRTPNSSIQLVWHSKLQDLATLMQTLKLLYFLLIHSFSSWWSQKRHASEDSNFPGC